MMKDSAGPLVLVLLGFISASVLAADKPLTHDGIAVGKNSKTHTSLPWTCTQTPLNTDPSSSVDSLRPSDVAALTAVGLPPTPGSQMAKVVDRLHEVLSIFNPAVVNMLPDQTNPDPTKHRTLVEQAEGLISTLNTQQMIDPERDWKLLLLFVHFDEQCVCTEQVKAVLQEVESALQVLHSQLKRTMVNVVLWDAEPVTEHAQQSRSCACSGTLSEGERQLTRAVFALALQESITRHLLDKAWYSDRDDFTVQIQGRPIITKQSPTTDEAASQTDKLLLQLWANLLQPTADQQNTNDKLQCPSEERPFFKTEKNSPSDVASRYDESVSLSSTVWSGTSFPCTVLSPSSSIPTSVHAVRPADVKVVAAIGDSLTAGNGIGSAQNDLLDVLTQYRGLSWSIGGDSSLSTVTTLPNILKKFNPYVKGFSTGTGKPDTSQAFLNQAVAGAKAEDLVTQARALISRMKGDSRINFQSDWKVITVFIGGNDLCDSCHNTAHYSSTNFVNRVKAALDIFHKEVPRAIVNLVEPLYILPLRQLHKDTSLNCPTWVVDMICSCVIGPADGSTAYQQLINLNRAYQQGLVNLVKSGRYNTNSGFTVVLQPAFRNIVVPVVNGHPDRSYFAPDCFHTSKKGQTLMARALWNNMVEREGYKNTKLDFAQSYNLKCTTSSAPYIRTIQNSKSAYNAIDMETRSSLPWTCSQTPLNTDPSSSVDSLRPSDVAALTAVGLPLTPGSQMAKVVDRLHEVLSIFNPAVVNMLPDQTNPDPTKHRTLLEQAEGLISTLNTQQMIDPEKDWKLLLLFVHFDEQCVCTEQVKAVLQEVESALQVLHSQLKRTMVNVVLWDAEPVTEHAQQSRSCACSGTLSEGERQLTRAVFALALQESITRHLLDKAWYSDRDDFTVQIQGRPIITKQSPTTDEAASQTDKLLLQLWANLLQPTGDQQNTNDKLQCPSEERPFFKTEKNSPSDVASRFDESASLSSTVWSGTSFPCTVLSPSSSIPTSVHAVRPADVKVVAAIGDSLTAGNGIGSAQNDLLDVLTQYRGLSWSIGGDSSLSTVTTLPNILKKFNPYVKGFSTGTGKPDTSQAFLNQAVAGAKAEDLVTQARALISRMKGDSRINFQSDWKVITVFIGGNDLCDSCHNTAHYSSTNFVNRVKAALDIFHKEVPRAIVNLVEPLYILPLRQLHKDTSLNCPTWVVDMICSCVIGPADGSTAYQQLINLNRAYQQGLVNLVKSGRYNTNSGFTVVLQPAFRNIVVPVVNGHPDRSYFAPDCFHTSKKGQTLMARALWNNMVEREGYKNTKLDFAQSYNLKCTTSSAPYIRTIQNSKSAYNAIDMETRSSLPWTCAQTPLNTDPSSSVDSLRPSDVAALTAVGLPLTPGSQMAKVVDRLHEVLSIFNPAVVNMLPDQTNPDPTKHRTLLEQAEGLISTLNTQQMIDPEKDWKLLLLFVHFDEQCVCTEQVKAVLQEVESALQVLHSQLKRTMVNVVLWDAEPVTEHAQQSRSCACSGTLSEGERQLTRAVFALALQESITRHLLDKAWYSDRDDFTVQIQGRPIITKQSPTTDEAASQTDKLLLQLWANLLQPTGDQQNTNDKLQCPSEERPFFKTEKNSPSDVASRFDESASLSSTVWSGTSFPCTVLSPSSSIPTSVHAVRPADVKVVAAIGDSLTAGNGIGSAQNDLLDVLTQYRGLSWSIGGDSSLSTVTTLPNILKKFNPYVKGFSTGTGKPDTSQAFLNQAVAGATAEDLVTQARALISRMKGDSRINFQSDWKVITVFIGGNDLCDSCHNTAHYSSTNFVNRVKAALDIFHKEVPRAIVNLVEPLYILPLRQLHKDTSLNCPTWVVDMICSCVIGPADGSTAYQQLINLNRAYQQGLVNLVNSGRYNTNSGFTVVLQPAFRNIVVPVVNGHPDRSYFAPDCFHTSKKGQTLMARALWNNMVEREGYKNTKLDFAQSYNLKCTTSSAPYIRTIQNSKSAYNAIDMEPMMISNGNSSSSVTSPETPPILKCPDPMPLWVPVGLGISGLLIGMFVSWLLFSWRQRQLEKRRALENIIEMKGTGL